jgi:uncharacterized protein (DUF58 family)
MEYPDPRVYVDLAGLIALRHEARRFSFPPRPALRSLLYGRRQSRLRGRGLDLEELRQYYPGDDIRLMDWKATIRTGKPHVRAYTEERDRPSLILVDQRISMFFGSRFNMKSVAAAETTALCAWQSASAEDRVGALIFNDDAVFEIRPQRTPSAVLRILRAVVEFNGKLKAGEDLHRNDGQLNTVLSKAEKLCTHDFLVIIISDLHGWDRTSVKRIKNIARHNDVIIYFIYDPLEKHLPPRGRYVVSDGKLQIEFDAEEKNVRERFSDHFVSRIEDLSVQLKTHHVPVIWVDTLHRGKNPSGRVTRGLTGQT